jgi:ectoine hydroxylase-related dioxygenase (phytanoyl-CoA dioxygenase family)
MSDPGWRTEIIVYGYSVLPAVFSAIDVDAIVAALESAFRNDAGSTMRAADGSIYGARNLLQLCPMVRTIWTQPPLPEILTDVLGPHFGLVRVLYFDKPPEQSWALPWHKDFAIAVKDNRPPSEQFKRPTTKMGVPHVEAPEWLLEQMVTLRLHLDDITDENGPLKVVPGSHRGDEKQSFVTILGPRGDVLMMRPLLSHCSNRSKEGTSRHRRILHFEFAGVEELPDGYEWQDFIGS